MPLSRATVAVGAVNFGQSRTPARAQTHCTATTRPDRRMRLAQLVAAKALRWLLAYQSVTAFTSFPNQASPH